MPNRLNPDARKALSLIDAHGSLLCSGFSGAQCETLFRQLREGGFIERHPWAGRWVSTALGKQALLETAPSTPATPSPSRQSIWRREPTAERPPWGAA